MTFDETLCEVFLGELLSLFLGGGPGQDRDYSFNRGDSHLSYKNAIA